MACRDAAQSHCEGVSTELAEREAHLEEQLQVRETQPSQGAVSIQADLHHALGPATLAGVKHRQPAQGVVGSDGNVCVPGCAL